MCIRDSRKTLPCLLAEQAAEMGPAEVDFPGGLIDADRQAGIGFNPPDQLHDCLLYTSRCV